jgi:hypothetical protein
MCLNLKRVFLNYDHVWRDTVLPLPKQLATCQMYCHQWKQYSVYAPLVLKSCSCVYARMLLCTRNCFPFLSLLVPVKQVLFLESVFFLFFRTGYVWCHLRNFTLLSVTTRHEQHLEYYMSHDMVVQVIFRNEQLNYDLIGL